MKGKKNLSLLIFELNLFFFLYTTLVAALHFIILIKVNYVLRLNGLIILLIKKCKWTWIQNIYS